LTDREHNFTNAGTWIEIGIALVCLVLLSALITALLVYLRNDRRNRYFTIGLLQQLLPEREIDPSRHTRSQLESIIKREGVQSIAGQVSLQESVIPFDMLKLGDVIATGSFADVYRGSFHGIAVAVKVLHPKLAQTRDGLEEFKREALLLCRRAMLHENVLFTFGVSFMPALDGPMDGGGAGISGGGGGGGTKAQYAQCNRGQLCIVSQVRVAEGAARVR
jgi:hypothetical protein